ncbi:MAG: phytoene synthase [Cereibacter sphaeroides]|uniref:Phytoene synthase n=1 Tax=Cereibacter sphaeroides TaxID=1063 RepID=A0A2W5SJG7_CERSP|nr:MAG: phytoene synthase [Cereibacter sphaeroides]
MSIEACAALVARGDPDRFAAVMAAPVAARERLLPLYAFNLEVARAPWVTQEPMIAEMRLQWWRDTVEMIGQGATPRAHEVAGPLAQLVSEAGLPLDVMDRLIEARRWDIYRDPFADQAAFDDYLEDTGAGLMWLAAKATGAPAQAESVARDAGWAAGLAGFLRAVPELEARGRIPLSDRSDLAISALAGRGLMRLQRARANRVAGMSPYAFLAGWQTGRLLRQAQQRPELVIEGGLGMSDFARKGGLLWAQLTGSW